MGPVVFWATRASLPPSLSAYFVRGLLEAADSSFSQEVFSFSSLYQIIWLIKLVEAFHEENDFRDVLMGYFFLLMFTKGKKTTNPTINQLHISS